MKKIITYTALLLGLTLPASAQQIASLYDSPSYAEPNTYYKDLYNDLDPFVGTWTYTNGSTSLNITLQKKIRVLNDNFFEDMLIGGYKYVLNGTIVVNTLPLLDNNYTDPIYYPLYGSRIIGPNSPVCQNGDPDTRLVTLAFDESDRDVYIMGPEMQFQRVDDGGVQKVKVVFKSTVTALPDSPTHTPEFSNYSVPSVRTC